MIPARLSVVTLGARDLPGLRDFYCGLGWPVAIELDDFAAIGTRGAVLALYSLEALAADGGVDAAPPAAGLRGFSLAVNVDEREEVDAVMAAVERAGGRVTKAPTDAEWGGRSGYFSDPEENYWEVAWVPPGNQMAALLRAALRPPPGDAHSKLVAELRAHALVIGEVTLTSGAKAQYYVDAKRAVLRPAGFVALGELVAEAARRHGATAVGGMTMGADPVACAALAADDELKAFFVRKERKAHGLQRWIEGPLLEPGERCLIVEDVVTTGGSTVQAIERVREEGLVVAGVVSVLDRLAGGAAAIEAAAQAPYEPLTTIDDVYPEREDR